MEIFVTDDALTERTKAVTLLATDASEEIFLSEIMRVLRRPRRGDRIKVTRADGESYLTWRPARRANKK